MISFAVFESVLKQYTN